MPKAICCERDEYRRMLIEIRIMATNAKPIQRDIIDFIDDAFCDNSEENETLEALLREYSLALSKHEPPGLLMNAVGRKLLFDIVKEEK